MAPARPLDFCDEETKCEDTGSKIIIYANTVTVGGFSEEQGNAGRTRSRFSPCENAARLR